METDMNIETEVEVPSAVEFVYGGDLCDNLVTWHGIPEGQIWYGLDEHERKGFMFLRRPEGWDVQLWTGETTNCALDEFVPVLEGYSNIEVLFKDIRGILDSEDFADPHRPDPSRARDPDGIKIRDVLVVAGQA